MPRPYTPTTHQSFWCKTCDTNSVDSLQSESGDFFVVFGHAYDQTTKEYDGEYLGVMFAVCKDCQAVSNKH